MMFKDRIDKIYHSIFYPLLISGSAKYDRSIAHERAISVLRLVDGNYSLLCFLRNYLSFKDPILETEIFGKKIPNPLGVAAGLDKNFLIPNVLGIALGFGLIEEGTVSFYPYGGNQGVKILHLPEDQGYINNVGLASDGLEKIKKRVEQKWLPQYELPYLKGINFGANKISLEKGTALEDSLVVFETLYPFGDYFVRNFSSPNTKGLKETQKAETIEQEMIRINRVRLMYKEQGLPFKPILYKIGPDLPKSLILEIADALIQNKADGIVATNTNSDPKFKALLKSNLKNKEGGYSGAALNELALEISSLLHEYVDHKLVLLRSGGVSNPKDYWDAISFGGASGVQILSSLVEPKTTSMFLNFYLNQSLSMGLKEKNISVKLLKGSKIPYPLK